MDFPVKINWGIEIKKVVTNKIKNIFSKRGIFSIILSEFLDLLNFLLVATIKWLNKILFEII